MSFVFCAFDIWDKPHYWGYIESDGGWKWREDPGTATLYNDINDMTETARVRMIPAENREEHAVLLQIEARIK